MVRSLFTYYMSLYLCACSFRLFLHRTIWCLSSVCSAYVHMHVHTRPCLHPPPALPLTDSLHSSILILPNFTESPSHAFFSTGFHSLVFPTFDSITIFDVLFLLQLLTHWHWLTNYTPLSPPSPNWYHSTSCHYYYYYFTLCWLKPAWGMFRANYPSKHF